MKNSTERRRKYFVDPQVQGAIIWQAAWYWLYGSMTYAAVVSLYRIFPRWLSGEPVDTGMIWYHLAPMVVSSAVLFPIVMLCALRFSNRFVGPMIRFRRVLKKFAHGETVPSVELRENDFWKDVADELNLVSARLSEVSAKSERSEEQLVECAEL